MSVTPHHTGKSLFTSALRVWYCRSRLVRDNIRNVALGKARVHIEYTGHVSCPNIPPCWHLHSAIDMVGSASMCGCFYQSDATELANQSPAMTHNEEVVFRIN